MRCSALAPRAPSRSTGATSRRPCASGWARAAVLGASELAGYEAIERPPLDMSYRGREVLTNPPPSAGGTLLAYSLALLDRRPSPAAGWAM